MTTLAHRTATDRRVRRLAPAPGKTRASPTPASGRAVRAAQSARVALERAAR